MKYSTGLWLVLLLVATSGAQAAGVNLRWDNCASEGGVANKNFACNTNAGAQSAVASFVLPAPQLQVVAVEGAFDVSIAASTVPPWWDLVHTTGCRGTSLTSNAVINPADLVCQDWAMGAAAGGLGSYTIGTFGPNTARIYTAWSVSAPNIQNLAAGPEYFVENVVIRNLMTVGFGSCSGCSIPACIGIESLKVDGTAGTLITLTQPANGVDSNFASWQGAIGVPSLPNGACPAVVPTRNSTWSSIKSLYR